MTEPAPQSVVMPPYTVVVFVDAASQLVIDPYSYLPVLSLCYAFAGYLQETTLAANFITGEEGTISLEPELNPKPAAQPQQHQPRKLRDRKR